MNRTAPGRVRLHWAIPSPRKRAYQAGARGTEEGTGGESKEEEKKGQPGPFSGKMTGAIVHFSTFCTARPPKRIAARAASH